MDMEKNLGKFAHDTLMSAGIPDGFWTDLNSQCDVILYGGAVRDFLFHYNGVIRDFDFVFAGLQSGFLEKTAKRFFQKEEYVRNRFGGLKLTKNGLSIDCWRLEDTYAFRHGILKASVENLIQAPMLNIDQYAYHMRTQEYFSREQPPTLPRNIDFVLYIDELLELNLLRAVVYGEKYSLPLAKPVKDKFLYILHNEIRRKKMSNLFKEHFGNHFIDPKIFQLALEG